MIAVNQTRTFVIERHKNTRKWWAREVCPGKTIPMAYVYKPPHLRVLNAKVFSERLQTAAADSRLSRDCRHALRTSSAAGAHRPSLVIDHRGHIASPPIRLNLGNMTEGEQAGGHRETKSEVPLGLLWNGAVTVPAGRRANCPCTGHAAGGSAAMPPPSDEVASMGPTG